MKGFTGWNPELRLNRREVLAATGGGVAGLAALGLLPAAAGADAAPTYGGSISIGLRGDVSRLDPHHFFLRIQPPTLWHSSITD